MKKGFISLLLAATMAVCCVPATALSAFASDVGNTSAASMAKSSATDPSEFKYSVADGEVTITKYIGSSVEVVIPSEIEQSPVTAIGRWAFSGCNSLTSVIIPNSVTSIANYAFSGCSGLASITIPNSVTSIGANVFNYCDGLTSITIPNSVTSIGKESFYACNGLRSINVDEDNPNYSSLNGVLFNKAKTELIQYPEKKAGKVYTIPDSVTSIGTYAFFGCSELTGVAIPNSVTSIGDGAFFSCDGLTSVTIPNGVASIGDGVFYGCSGLTRVTIPHSVTTIVWNAFSDCGELREVFIENTSNIYDDKFGSAKLYFTQIGDNAYWSVNGDTLNLYGDGELYGISADDTLPWADFMPELKNIEIADGITNISPIIFTSIMEDELNNATESVVIGGRILVKYVGGKNAKIDGNIKIVCADAFDGTVTSVALGDNINSIASGAFGNSSVVIKGYEGSAAEKFATDNGLTFEKLEVVKGCVTGGNGETTPEPTMADAMLLFNGVVENNTASFFCNAAADVDGDGNVTLLDVLLLLLIMEKA